MKKILFIIIAVLAVLVVIEGFAIRGFEKSYNTALQNIKAMDGQLSSSASSSAAYKLTVEQMRQSNDSLLQKLDSVREALNIKAKNLSSSHVILSKAERKDTVIFDTIFMEGVDKDTVISGRWYSLALSLRYPDSVVVKPSFQSRKYIMVSTRKETVNPPKKLWILRLFQKRHKVLRVDVVEENPYVTDSVSKYVEIIK